MRTKVCAAAFNKHDCPVQTPADAHPANRDVIKWHHTFKGEDGLELCGTPNKIYFGINLIFDS